MAGTEDARVPDDILDVHGYDDGELLTGVRIRLSLTFQLGYL